MAKGTKQSIEALTAARQRIIDGETDLLLPFLKAGHPYVLAAAARLCGESEAYEHQPLLKSLLLEFLDKGKDADPGCAVKTDLAKALVKLDCMEPEPFVRGVGHTQLESGFPDPEDTAAELRAVSLNALINMGYREALFLAVDLLADKEAITRRGAAEALGLCRAADAELVLRMKARQGDSDPDVTGACLTALLEINPERSLPFLANFLKDPSPDVVHQAALAIGESRLPQAFPVLMQAWEDSGMFSPNRRLFMLPMVLTRQKAALEFLVGRIAKESSADAREAVQALATFRHDEALAEQVNKAVKAKKDHALTQTWRQTFGR